MRRHRLLVPLVALPLALAGCTTVEDRRAADDGRCRSYGFRPGTEAYSKCLLDLDLNRDADRRVFVGGPYGYGPGFGYGFGYGSGRRFY